jgi:excisionase family DNA binding protein
MWALEMKAYSINDVAARLGVSRRTIERRIAGGALRTVRTSKRRLAVTAESLVEALGAAEYLRLFRGEHLAQAYEALREAADTLAPIRPDLARRVAEAAKTLLSVGC